MMSRVPRRRPEERVVPQIGDVIEIRTPNGLAYIQYTHEHRDPPRMGSLLRVLPGVFDQQPDLASLVEQEERFSVFFPLHAALRRGIFRIVASEPIPPNKRQFPIFRSQARDELSAGPWYYWDGKREWRESRRRRTPEWRRRALNEVWNDTLLVDRIASGWSPPDDA
jgi:hypothetical protein